VCGERSNQVALGVSWFDGEQRVRAMNPDGGYRSRGPVLYAMHIIKLERFVERHFECGVWALKKQGGQLNRNETLPQYLIWAYRFGTPDDLLTAVDRALSAGVPKARIAKELGPGNVYEEEEYRVQEQAWEAESKPAPLEVPAYPANLPGDEDIPF